MGRDRRLAVLLAFGNIGVAILQFLDPLLFGRVVGLLAHAADLPPGELWRAAARLLGLWAAAGAAGIAINMLVVLNAERLAHRNRLLAMQRFFAHVLSLPLAFHGEAHSGRMMKIMLSGADAMAWLWLSFFREQLATFIAALVLLPLTLLLNWRLALTLIALVLLAAAAMALAIRRTEAGQRRAQRYQIALAGSAQDALANVSMMQAFGQVQPETRRFGDIVAQVIEHQFPVLAWWAAANVMTRAASTVAMIAIVAIGTLLTLRGLATIGDIVSFMSLASLLIGRLDGAMQFSARLFFELPNLADYFTVIDTASSVPQHVHAHALSQVRGEIVFDRVGFGYPGGPTVLHDISFTATPGRVVALVGRTGAGKSTAMALLQRAWDPQTGRITIDGHDLRELQLDSLRGSIGVVFQDSMLLNRSIRDNLLIGNPHATQAELDAACRLADAEEFIVRQPHGMDTLVGERGTTLSGGQRQRLAIARAALKDPPILILDEATSALDTATEARIGRALAALMRGRTTFIIAHRLSTVREADEILVFEAGRIVERGGFADLIARGGGFSELVATQLAPAV